MRPEGFGKLKKFNDLIGNQTRDVPVCSIAPQPLRYSVPPFCVPFLHYVSLVYSEWIGTNCSPCFTQNGCGLKIRFLFTSSFFLYFSFTGNRVPAPCSVGRLSVPFLGGPQHFNVKAASVFVKRLRTFPSFPDTPYSLVTTCLCLSFWRRIKRLFSSSLSESSRENNILCILAACSAAVIGLPAFCRSSDYSMNIWLNCFQGTVLPVWWFYAEYVMQQVL
jgi:hypothetical protein